MANAPYSGKARHTMAQNNTEACEKGSCEGCPSAASCKKDQKQRNDKAGNPQSSVKHCIGIASGKGGVGKSTVTALLAIYAARAGYRVGILDADILGPSIPRLFGLKEKAAGSEAGIYPVNTTGGIRVMSINLLLEHEEEPVLWRGPLLAGAVRQFWTDVVWGPLDFLFIDMPPGTGDVPMTVYQSLPMDGVILVTSPQQLVGMIVEKAAGMARQMQIPVLGTVENYSFVRCPDCGKQIELFGKQAGEVLDRLPIDPALSALCDAGKIERFSENYLPNTLQKVLELEKKPN